MYVHRGLTKSVTKLQYNSYLTVLTASLSHGDVGPSDLYSGYFKLFGLPQSVLLELGVLFSFSFSYGVPSYCVILDALEHAV